MKIKLNLKPTYKITPVFSTEGRGKKKQDIFRYIDYRFELNRAIAVKGVVSKKDIEETIPFLESMNIDFYDHLIGVIINEMIIQVNDLYETKMTHVDFKDFINEHQDLFNTFANELKNIINEHGYETGR